MMDSFAGRQADAPHFPGEATDLFIREFSFWQQLTEEQKELLCHATKPVHYAKGQTLVGGSDRCLGVLIIKKGQLRVYTLSEDGRDITLQRLFPGEVCILSAWCVMSQVTIDVFIDAEEETDALRTDAAAFQSLAKQNIYVKCFSYEMATARLSRMVWTMQQILFLSVDRRLAMFLLEESEARGTDELRLTHEQIARYMGSAREVVSRLLKYFSEEGMVKAGRGVVMLTNREKLEKLANR